MKISILGMGYVGIVSAVCLASKGHYVIGVDVNQQKVNLINEGLSPIVEKYVPELLKKAVEEHKIIATTDTSMAIQNSELSIVCVGTPSRSNGSLNTTFLEIICEQIGQEIANMDRKHIIVFRSTMLPGTVKELLVPRLEKISEKKEKEGFFVAFNPEFLRESTAVYDFENPPKTVVGCDDPIIAQQIMSLYDNLPGPKIITELEIAEMVKYVDNNYHALKVTFANEFGEICKSLKIDSHKVMNIFKMDTKLNISTTYLTPGFAFGGSCLPKDLRAINYFAKMNDLEVPLLNSILRSNQLYIINGIKKIMEYGKKKIGIAGLSFKEGTDDLRESPIVEVIETLLGKGYEIKIYDKNVSLSKLVGANKEYLNHHIPHISSLLVDSLDYLLNNCDLIVIANNDQEFKCLIEKCKPNQKILDLVRIEKELTTGENYEGICW